jgi:GT2 family glycosyltransferase
MSEKRMTTLDFSIVVVSHNHRGVIEKCFDSLYSLPDRASFEALLIDNTCTDGAADWVEQHYPRVKVHRNAARHGFAANANTGMRMLERGRYVLLLNPDVTSIAGLLDRLVDFMDAHADAGIAAPRLFHADGTRQPNCRRFPTPAMLAMRALRMDELWRSSQVRRYLMDDREHAQAAEVDWVTGAALVARRSAIAEVGMMDERYFLYWEDLDWCYRMRRAGWHVYYVPEARAVHGYRREGVRRPISRAGREQMLGALKFFRKFGWRAGKVA